MSLPSLGSTHSPSAASDSLENGSFSHSHVSSITSDPFENASALDSASSHVLSFYLDPDPSEAREPPVPLRRLIRRSGHTGQVLERLLGMVSMIVHIGATLFPHSHILREDIIKEVQFLTTAMIDYLQAVHAHIGMRLARTRDAFKKLPSPAVTDAETLALSISKWSTILDELHMPNGVEARIFRKMSTLYDTHVYAPFLQLHRIEPDHNMYQLDEHLTPIYILLQDVFRGAMKADRLVMDIEQEFELTMSAEPSPSFSKLGTPKLTAQPATPPSNITPARKEPDTGVDRKRQHTPSKSAPVVIMTRPLVRQRAETVQ
ncbi:hypothetical protein MBLNU459_g6390t1 [Dothideomycetes sp. NU459]